ncbi:LexA family protein [Streptomyces sp. Tu6071]|uniref:LexA family protein n=1 Tax=Streptomyces sp. Tu6071 TaxID=355249 RepID=UPI0018F86542|nr:helix-turn-helix domain-containing protein [Streptomyces sp. Tu6071]
MPPAHARVPALAGDQVTAGDGRHRVLAAVRDTIAETGQGPSVRQIQRVTGLALGTIAHHLKALEESGPLVRTGLHWRTCRLG